MDMLCFHPERVHGVFRSNASVYRGETIPTHVFCSTYLRAYIAFCPVHTCFFKAFVVVWHTFICTFAVSLLAAYVQQDVLAYHTLL